MPEVEARRGALSYEEWEKKFLPLNGIVGKVLDESSEHEGKYDNLPFFLRYKENNPSKLALLHYHGAGRRATDTTAGFFAGHWLHYAGTNLVREVDADPDVTVLHVADTSVFTLDRAQGVGDDVALAPIGDDGKPDWGSVEQVRLEEIDAENETITVERGAYGTEPSSFPAGSYLAAHVLIAPYPSEDNPIRNVTLWSYNFSTVGPRDAEGRNGAGALVDHLVEQLGPGYTPPPTPCTGSSRPGRSSPTLPRARTPSTWENCFQTLRSAGSKDWRARIPKPTTGNPSARSWLWTRKTGCSW